MAFWGAAAGVAAGAPGALFGALGAAPGVAVWVVCCCGGGVLAGGNNDCQPTMMITDSTIATMKFFWSISACFHRRAGEWPGRRHGIEALAAPRTAATESL